MKNTDNNGNSKLGQTNAAEQQGKHDKSVSNDAPHTMLLAQLDSEGQAHALNAPATIVLAQANSELPVPLITEQDGIPDNASAESQPAPVLSEPELQNLDSAASANPPANTAANPSDGGIPGSSTLLTVAELQNLDSTAAGNPIGDSIEDALYIPFGNLDGVDDTRYDWDRPTPPIEYKYGFDQDFTPEIAEAPFNPVPIATDDFIGTVIRGSCCDRGCGGGKGGKGDYYYFDGKGKGGCCGPTYNELEFNILPNDIFSSDNPNIISSITVILGGIPQTFTPAEFNGTLYVLDDGSSFTLYTDGSLYYTGPSDVNNCELPGPPETVKIFDYVLSDSTPDSDPASVYVQIYDPPVIQIGNACAVEGDQLAFEVTIFGELPPGFVLHVPYYTYDGSAQNGPDYTGVYGELIFNAIAGQSSQTATILVDTLEDCYDECTENMYIELDTSCTIINECSHLNDTSGKGIIFDQPEPIPEQPPLTGNSNSGLFVVFEAGLPNGTGVGNTNTLLTGNVFFDFGLNPNQTEVHIQQLLNPLYVLDDSDADAVTLTSDHFIFTIDTSDNGIGDYGSWTYELTGNVMNPPPAGPESTENESFLENIVITLCPLPDDCGCGCNYDNQEPALTNIMSAEGSEYGGWYNSDECGCEPPVAPCTDMTLEIRIVDDVQIANDDCVLVPVCCDDKGGEVEVMRHGEGMQIQGEGEEEGECCSNLQQVFTGNVLDNDIPSADRIPDGPNASNGMTVFFVSGPGFVGGALAPDVDNVFTTTQGSTFVIRQDGSYEYTRPEGGLAEEEVITYFTFDADGAGGSNRSATITFKPNMEDCDDDAPIAVEDCGCEEAPIPTEWSILVHFNNTSASYHNSFGYYIKDANGFPTEGKVIWEDVNGANNNADFLMNQINLPNVNPCDIGYFIIPNGSNHNNINDGTAVTFILDENNNWQAQTTPGNVLLTGEDANVYFDNGNLNIDNYPHVNNVGGNFNWEDLFAGGDQDFNDVQVNIQNNFECPTCGITGQATGNVLDNDYMSTDGGNRVSLVTFNGESFVVPDGGLLQLTDADLVNPPGYDFVLLMNSDGSYTFTPPLNFSNEELHIDFLYTLVDIDGDESSAEFCFEVLPQQEVGIESLSLVNSNDDAPLGDAPIANDDANGVSEAHLGSGSHPDAALLSVHGNILANDSAEGPVQIMNVGGVDVSGSDLASGFKIVDTASGEIKVYLATGDGHNQGDYVYTLMNASGAASDSIAYSILANSQLSTATIDISIADDAPSAVSHDVMVWEQPIVAGQSDGMIVSSGNVLDGAKSGADAMPVAYSPKTAVDAISFEVLNLSNANQAAFLALGAVISVLAGNISKVALAIPLNGDITFGLPDGALMSIGSDGHYSLAQPAQGISADKSYEFKYEITDNDGSKSEADLNIAVKNFNAPLANDDHIWSLDSGTTNINVLDNDVLNGDVKVKEITYQDINNLSQTAQVPQSGNGNNAFVSFVTHSGAEVKIDRDGNLQYKPGALANGQSDVDTLGYKIVETSNSNHSSMGEIKAHVFDANADYTKLTGNNGPSNLDASDLTGTVSMTGANGNNTFKIDLSNPSASNHNPSEIAITDLFKSGATNTLAFTHVSDSDGVAGLGIGDILSSIGSVSQVKPNGDIHVSFNNGTNLSIQDPGFTMSMPSANEFLAQLQEHSVTVSAQI